MNAALSCVPYIYIDSYVLQLGQCWQMVDQKVRLEGCCVPYGTALFISCVYMYLCVYISLLCILYIYFTLRPFISILICLICSQACLILLAQYRWINIKTDIIFYLNPFTFQTDNFYEYVIFTLLFRYLSQVLYTYHTIDHLLRGITNLLAGHLSCNHIQTATHSSHCRRRRPVVHTQF